MVKSYLFIERLVKNCTIKSQNYQSQVWLQLKNAREAGEPEARKKGCDTRDEHPEVRKRLGSFERGDDTLIHQARF